MTLHRELAGVKIGAANPVGKTLTKKDLIAIKKKIGYSNMKTPLPKCPAKSKKKVRGLRAMGDLSHGDVKHAPCPLCACTFVAGRGTSHYGWGLCRWHEQMCTPEAAAKKAEDHLLSLQQRHPKYYHDAGQVMLDVVKKGEIAERAFDLPGLIQKAHGLSTDFFDCLTDFEKHRRNAKPIVEKIDALTEAIHDRHKEIPEQQWLEIHEALQALRAKMESPLTEITQHGLVPMSDKTRITLMASVAEKLARATKIWHEIEREDWVTSANFEVWAKRLVTEFSKTFGEYRYTTDEGDFRILAKMAECWASVGEPRKGT